MSGWQPQQNDPRRQRLPRPYSGQWPPPQIAFGAGYFAKVPAAKALSELPPNR